MGTILLKCKSYADIIGNKLSIFTTRKRSLGQGNIFDKRVLFLLSTRGGVCIGGGGGGGLGRPIGYYGRFVGVTLRDLSKDHYHPAESSENTAICAKIRKYILIECIWQKLSQPHFHEG